MNTATTPPGPSPGAPERLLAAGRGGGLPRTGLGRADPRRDDAPTALMHAEKALAFDPEFTAAWRLQGLLALALGDAAKAEASFAQALEVAQRRGELQLVKELTVRLRRLRTPKPPAD